MIKKIFGNESQRKLYIQLNTGKMLDTFKVCGTTVMYFRRRGLNMRLIDTIRSDELTKGAHGNQPNKVGTKVSNRCQSWDFGLRKDTCKYMINGLCGKGVSSTGACKTPCSFFDSQT